jgi:trk system potassium uptake protein TrkH
MSAANKLVLIMLMFIGGSPGSTAGGIKTVTLVVVIMVVYATLLKKRNVEIFKRSIRPVVVGRAVTVTVLFAAVLLLGTLMLTLTERANAFATEDIMFETASALGTVGLSTGITPDLTTAGKMIIIITMLIGRLGPLTLLASLMFNLKPVGYDYPSEAIIVG